MAGQPVVTGARPHPARSIALLSARRRGPESWIWQDKPEIGKALGFRAPGSLRRLLKDQGIWPEGQTKPDDPKET
ncbi:MAG TPA: hypothetical protein VGG06_34215, partial [Thermoanaerobaculia bacterium]